MTDGLGARSCKENRAWLSLQGYSSEWVEKTGEERFTYPTCWSEKDLEKADIR